MSCFVGDSTRQKENMRFFEPHALCLVMRETVYERQTMCGSSNHTSSVLFFWEKIRDRKITCGSWNLIFSVLPCGRWYTTGREHEVLGTSCSLSCLAGNSIGEAENVWFEEPHILCRTLWEVVCDRKRTCGSWNLMSSVLSCGKQYTRGRECVVRRTTHSLS